MVKFHSSAVLIFVSASLLTPIEAFSPAQKQSVKRTSIYSTTGRRTGNDAVTVSATASATFASGSQGEEVTWKNFLSSSSAYLNSLSRTNVVWQNGENDDDPSFSKADTTASVAGAGNAVILSRDVARQTVTYEAALPLYSTTTAEQTLGMTLRQIDQKGQMSSVVLDMDTLQYVSVSALSNSDLGDEEYFGEERVMSAESSGDFVGVVVSSVKTFGVAYKAGIRPGDFILATSATVGDNLWPKSTLEGVRSAVSSRKIMSNKPEVVIRFRRSREHIAASEVVESFELTLTRPIGIQIENSPDGQVVITGFSSSTSSSTAESYLKIGDRIVAVDSSLGSQMWPVSSVEGIVSAVTTRLPGQPVRFRIERSVQVGEYPQQASAGELTTEDSVTPALIGAVDGFRQLASTAAKPSSSINSATSNPVIPSIGSNTHKLLLTRCRDVLRTYNAKAKEQAKEDPTTANKILVLAADRVLEALADARAPLDAKTLALIMNSYTTTREPEKAIVAFETAVGLSADGSAATPTRTNTIKGKKNADARIPSDLAALDLFTATALLRAHALNGDIAAARRVLAAMEGDGVTRSETVPASAWPVKLFPDARCYNVVLAAAAKAGGKEGIEAALDLYERMAEPGTTDKRAALPSVPAKNLVTYNTMISAFAKEGRSQDAYTIFYSMKQARMLPDKISYTSLIKALVEDGDITGGRALLREMKENGVEVDVFTYNNVIKALCKRLKWYEAKNLASEMESAGVSPNSITYGLLMNGLLKAGKPSACLTLFEAAYADPKTTALTENVQLYTTAVSAASALGDYERALELVSRMQKVGVKPTVMTMTALMGACLSCKKADLAVDVYRQMQSGTEKKTDGVVMALAIKAFCEQGDYVSAASILTEQRDGYHDMSGKEVMSSYNYLLRSALSAKEFQTARSTFSELLHSGYIPSKDTLKGILQGLGLNKPRRGRSDEPIQQDLRAAEKFDFLLFVIDSLRQRNLPCDAGIYSSILFEGARIGGSRKLISSLLSKNRSTASQPKSSTSSSWEELTKLNPSEIRAADVNQTLSLPSLYVPVAEREMRQVLAAENAVSMSSRRRRTAQVKEKAVRP